MIPISDVRKVSGGGAARAPQKAPVKRSDPIADGSVVARMLEALLADAAAQSATAVHLDPHGKTVHVRYRIDGLLAEGKALPVSSFALVVKRVKRLANVKVTESRLPQDGHFTLQLQDKPYTVRASILPVVGGERVVLHLIDQAAEPHDLQALGYWGQGRTVLEDAVRHARGLVLVGGSAGSGKSSTLYGLLHLAQQPSVSVATVEDPVKHHFAGMNQTPIHTKAGMTFADALRAVVRQDPNVLMVSDLREPVATGMVVQAALGGRLVFAGIQSHDLAATLLHIVAMHVEPYMLATALKVIVNQRLVRRLCPNCRESYRPAAGEFEAVCTALGLTAGSASEHMTALQLQAAEDLQVTVAAPGKGKSTFWRAKEGGCEACGYRGYKGRVAVSEVLSISPGLQKLIFSHATGAALYDQAMLEGMVPLPLDGLVKAALGITSIDEVLRAASE